MAEKPARRSPLSEVYQSGRFGSTRDERPGVTLSQRGPLGIVHLSAPRDEAAFRARAKESLGLALPVDPNTAVSEDARSVLWQAPGRWFVVAAQKTADPLGDLSRLCDEVGGAATDLSHGWMGLRIDGPAARHLLAKGCSLDLRPNVFGAGRCAQSEYRGIYIFVHVRGNTPRFHLYCQRSLARSLWGWLLDGAAEYGCEVK
ncbi:MAG: sarcosine oxidase subunit gamma [Gammaproteobacteria bacterium]|nr:sarcosine oxidase subunit gamma [Gammaproteobacteria bacterium]NIR85073.1 sarcosine oxidase subunit gamma [Gammaproteobacteria bacterium]NIR91883.1 sarcosine oxidase subunit gamma [Gammaproteobacteria bacterium]NIU06120.1 sarcosine oxidase subunit gamma [Gammaproteobacteria bacterium]NIV76935.1 sarcosine oxidase subunit gamma [Gammaproteobacteria bacterium]